MKTNTRTMNNFSKCSLLLWVFLAPISGVIAQDLSSYIELAEKNNPELAASELRYKRAAEREDEMSSLPDTEISAGYFVSEPETRTGPQVARFSVRQMIPWFGTITARKHYSNFLADAAYVDVAVARRQLALSVAQSYYTLYALREKRAVLREILGLLEVYHELSLTAVEVGKASAVDVLRLQIRQNELLQRDQTLEQEILAETVQFNNLLNREKEMEVTLVDSLPLPQEALVRESSISEVHPELLKYDKLFASVVASEKVNQKESLPKLGLGLDYVPVEERTDMMMDDNGKDILMPMLSVSIPIFSNKYASISRQNKIREQEIMVERDQRLNTLETMLAEAMGRVNAAIIAVKALQLNLEKTASAEEILSKNYETGTINFEELLEVQELQLEFKTGLIEAVQTFYMQTALVNYLTK